MKGKTIILLSALLLWHLGMAAQDSLGVRVHSTMFGGGFTDVYDTYLSPYRYTGGEVRVVRETYRKTKMVDGKVSVQTLVDVNLGYTDNRAGNAHEVTGGLRGAWNWFYPFLDKGFAGHRHLRLLAGGGLNGYLAGIYNTRNGNNPGQGKLNLMTDLSGMAEYDFRLSGKPMSLRYQLTMPLIGAAFSPNYGQSYYEMFSLGNYDRNVVFAWMGNMPSLSHLLTLDFPVSRSVIRIGYRGEFNQSTWNGLRYHQYSNCLMIGWVKTFGKTTAK
ncbi:MAG: DUF3316 domain-containing protein [Bacteroidaceae bacterium]|nr:DUF3316 domain-containing protein [Bacteroidaceae bacterium]